MQVERRRGVRVDGVEKLPELLTPMALMDFADDGAGLHVRRREQVTRAVTHVVVRVPFGLPGSHGQHRRRTGGHVDLRLFVYAKHQRAAGGSRYSPTMSRTFSTKSGSSRSPSAAGKPAVDSFNVSLRCGCNPNAR